MYTPSKRYCSNITCTREKDDMTAKYFVNCTHHQHCTWRPSLTSIQQPFHNHWLELLQVSFLSQQTRVCGNRSTVATSIFLSWQKTCFVATNTCLLQQAYFCCDKRCVLSWQSRICHNKPMFVATQMIHVAAPADDIPQAPPHYSAWWRLPRGTCPVCVISRCPITQCWTKIKVTAWATAAFRQANNCAWPAGVPSLNAGLKTRCRCLGNCCIQTGKCQCITSRCPITKCWTSKKQTRSLSGRLLHSNGHSMSQGKGILAAVDLIQTHAALMIVHKSGWVCRPYPLMGKHLPAL